MNLPITPPYPPIEALSTSKIPVGSEWQYEPKWDGFRCLAFRDSGQVELQSKAGQPLARYFPEIVDALLGLAPTRFVLDGELVIPVGDQLSFDSLLMRIHPAASRVDKLARATPSLLVLFDLLVDDKGSLFADQPLARRRAALERFARKYLRDHPRIRLSPATAKLAAARRWFSTRTGLDGVIAKRLDSIYESGQRSGAVLKVKRIRTADCVVGGFRYASKKHEVGSLLLGLYDQNHRLNHVGFTSSIHQNDRPKLTKRLEKLIKAPGFTGSAPGGPSRWSTKRSTEWQPLAPKLVVEVQYDHFSGGRFRHGTKFLRWRPDKAPKQCRISQVEHESRTPLPAF
jgi:ATP-dependent DNA ligase